MTPDPTAEPITDAGTLPLAASGAPRDADPYAGEDPYADPYAGEDPYADPYAGEDSYVDPYAGEDPYAESSTDPAGEAFAEPTAESLIELISAVWGSFVDDKIPLEPSFADRPPEIISGEVSISGAWAGRVTVSFEVEGARQVAARMFMMEDSEVEQDDLFDTVGEVANMIGGNVKSMFDGDCQLGLPVVHPPDSLPVPRQHGEVVTSVELSWGGTWLSVVLESTALEA